MTHQWWHSQTQISLGQQQLLFNGKEIPNTARLNGSGVVDGDLLMLVSAPTPSRYNEMPNP